MKPIIWFGRWYCVFASKRQSNRRGKSKKIENMCGWGVCIVLNCEKNKINWEW